MARSFSTLFFKAAKKLGRIQRAALNGPGAFARRRLALLGRWEASRQFTDGLGRRLAFALHSARRAAPGHAAGGHAARLSPDRAVVRAGFAHEPVGRRGRLHGAVPAAVHGPAGAALLALVPARRAARRRRGRPDRRAGPLGSGASWPGSDARTSPACRRAPAWRLLWRCGIRNWWRRWPCIPAVTGDARRRGPANHAPGRAQALRPLLESVANPAALRLGMPAIILQGQLDPAVAPRNARQLFDQFRLLNGLHPRMFRSSAYWGWARTNPIAGSTC